MHSRYSVGVVQEHRVEALKLKIEMNSVLLLNAMQFKKRPLPLLVLYYNGIPC